MNNVSRWSVSLFGVQAVVILLFGLVSCAPTALKKTIVLEPKMEYPSHSNVRIAVDGGYALYLSTDSYSTKAKGFCFAGDVRYNMKKRLYVGAHYDYFNGSFLRNGSFFPHGNTIGVSIDDGLYPIYGADPISADQEIQFFAFCFGGQGLAFSKKMATDRHRISFDLLLGYLKYKENGLDSGSNYQVIGATVGIGAGLSYDFMLTKHLSIGVGSCPTMAPWLNAKVYGIEDYPREKSVRLYRIDFKAGLRYYF